MQLISGQNYMCKFSVVHNQLVNTKVTLATLYNNAMRELSNNRGITVARGERQSFCFKVPINNIFSADDTQTDFILRFTCNREMSSSALDDVYGYAWNLTVGTPALPSGVPNRAGPLFAACSRFDTENRQGAFGFLSNHNYKQLCSQYVPISTLDAGSIEGGSLLTRFIGGRVNDAYPSQQIVGENINQSIDPVQEATSIPGRVADSVKEALGIGAGNEGDGLSGNDIRFMMYAGITILGLLVGARVLREVRKV